MVNFLGGPKRRSLQLFLDQRPGGAPDEVGEHAWNRKILIEETPSRPILGEELSIAGFVC